MKKLSLFLFTFCFASAFAQTSKTVTSIGETVVLNEDYSNNTHKWFEKADSSYSMKIGNGKYVLDIMKTGTYASYIPLDLKNSADFSISINTTHLEGVANNGFGLCFGAENMRNLFAFSIAADGHYNLRKYVHGSSIDLIKWKTSEAIKKENNVDNALTIKKQNLKWKFYINNQLVDSLDALPFMGYEWGMLVSDKQKIAFDNLVIKQSAAGSNETTLIKENFTKNDMYWDVDSTSSHTTSLVNGKYLYKNNYGGSKADHFVHINPMNDYSMSLSVKQLSGTDSAFSGLYFNARDLQNFYCFVIDKVGYMLLKIENDSTIVLVPHTKSDDLKKTGENILTIKKDGANWKLYINSIFQDWMMAEPALGSKIGVYIEEKQTVEFDDLIVKESPNNSSLYLTAYGNEKVLLNEDFSKNSFNWPVLKTTDLDWQITNGGYVRENKDGKFYSSAVPVNVNTSYDYAISLTAQHYSGKQEGAFGICFGYLDNKNQYVFALSPNGYYSVFKYANGVYQDIIKWTKNFMVHSVGDNILTVKKQGKDWKFYLNDWYLDKASAEPFFGNNIGVTSSEAQRVIFDDLIVTGAEKKITQLRNPTTAWIINDEFKDNSNFWYIDSTGKDLKAVIKDYGYNLWNYSSMRSQNIT